MRSFVWPRALTTCESALMLPLRTRNTLIRPANGSAIVLKTNADVPSPPTSIGAPFFAGEGTPSTRRSSNAVVPRFFFATPHATGKSSPRLEEYGESMSHPSPRTAVLPGGEAGEVIFSTDSGLKMRTP